MGKNLQKQDSNLHFRSNYHGCLRTILGFLDYHQWHGVKNLFPLKSHVRLSRPKGHGTPKTVLEDHDTVAVPPYFNKEAQTHADPIEEDISDRQSAEAADLSEMFRLNEKLFPEMFGDEEFGRFRSRNSCAKACLTKSISFPAVSSSGVRFYRPCTLENKRYESFPKRKNARRSSRPSKLRGWNQELVNRLRVIKKTMKQTFMEKRSKAISPIPTIDSNRTEIPESLDHLTMVEIPYESLERYQDLFAEPINDETKYRHSRSLTHTSGNKMLKNRLALSSSRRNLSSPDIEIFCSFFHYVAYDSSQTDKPIIDCPNQLTKNIREIDRNPVRTIGIADGFQPREELELENRIDEPDELIEDEPSIMHGIAEKNHSEELVSHLDDEDFWPQSNQILDIQTNSPDLPISDGIEQESSAIAGKRVSNNRHDWSSSDSIAAYSSIDHENSPILELSWMIESEAVGAHRSAPEPTSSVLDELDQQLLVELVNEALHDIDETSSTYFNEAFSFSRHILPRPTGKRLVWELQKRVGVHFRPGDGSLEEAMAADLCRGDGWMKIQLEAECLALEVEGLILDQLVDEVLLLTS